MSDIKLYRLHADQATELQGDASDLEKPLQTLIEKNLDTLLGIRFLATEYATGKTHGCPTIQPGRLRRPGRGLGLKKFKPQPIHLSQDSACSNERRRLCLHFRSASTLVRAN